MGTPGGGAAQRVETITQQLERKRALIAKTQQEISTLEAELHNWLAGQEGERRTAAVLDAMGAEGWLLLHDVHWPGRPQANLDHVAVGPGGVVVVDAKKWAGPVHVRGSQLRSGSWRKTRECENAARMASDVASLLAPQHRTSVSSVLCLVDHALTPTPVEAGVVAVGDAHLADHLRSLPRRFDDDDVRVVAAQLRELLTGATSPAVIAAAAPAAPTAPLTPRWTREAAASGRAPGERRVRRRPAPSKTQHLVTRLALLAGVAGGLYALPHLIR